MQTTRLGSLPRVSLLPVIIPGKGKLNTKKVRRPQRFGEEKELTALKIIQH